MKKLKSASKVYDVIVIGSGLAGAKTALTLANEGLSVALVEKDRLGGSAANYTSLPITVFAQTIRQLQQSNFTPTGGRSLGTTLNFADLKRATQQQIDKQPATNRNFYHSWGVDILTGRAHFINPTQIIIGQEVFGAKYFVIATGSQIAPPRIQGLDQINYLTPTSIFKLNRPPRNIFIVGGNQTGVELAQIFGHLGSKVYISELASRLLPELDPSLGQFSEKYLSRQLRAIVATSARVVAVVDEKPFIRVHFVHAGVKRQILVDQVLVTVEDQACTDLGLENAGVDYTPQGIITNQKLQTTAPHIYAVGDVLGLTGTNHDSDLESKVTSYNIIHNRKVNINYQATPQLIQSIVPMANVGLSEDDCLRQNIDYRAAAIPISDAVISQISGQTFGFVKLIVNAQNQLIGAQIAAPAADALIGELVIAIRQKMTINELTNLPRAFLSWNELITIAADKLLDQPDRTIE